MSRLTISLNDEIHLALKEAAVHQRRSIASLIEESLIFRGIKSPKTARNLVQQVRERSELSADTAMDIALAEVSTVRNNN